ncbi:hypothetical protein PIB30_071797 [Stylosanthes scabra]|uniref:Uncharacterized protein n=1 Tax=Stylosanthes scabra TaxID=79078 RepID=A0ABU6XMA3_9FABA|nr:hypothetical protein [Stylosanthes scabra]
MACNKGQHVRKAKKKQVKDELDRLKQAEKKKRRLEKALATSAAIISELEKKKQKKKEEQQRLDEEGAAIAEAVALHVLLGEDSEDSCKVVLNDETCKTWNCDRNLDFFVEPLGRNAHEKPLYEDATGWGHAGFSADLIAAQAVSSLQIAEADEERIIF